MKTSSNGAIPAAQGSVNIRVGFMSQVSPDGRHVITMINDPGPRQMGPGSTPQERVYVANFKDYGFGQVFFPTRGILAWYSRDNGKLQPLPGADDPHYVQTGAFWSPDGKYLVFSRALAKRSLSARAAGPPAMPTILTKPRFSTISIASLSTTAKAASRSRSPALPKTA